MANRMSPKTVMIIVIVFVFTVLIFGAVLFKLAIRLSQAWDKKTGYYYILTPENATAGHFG